MWTRFVVRVVELSRQRALWVTLAVLAIAALGALAATQLSVDADESKLLSPDLPWQQREAHYESLFPGTVDTLVVVIDAATPEQAEAAASGLARRLGDQPALFQSVERPDAGAFFRENGLLYLGVPELSLLSEHLIQAQPMIGSLAADPSLRGLFNALTLALTGAARGDVDPAALAEPLSAIAGAIKGAVAGAPAPVSWGTIFTGRAPAPEELRRFVLTRPVLDYSDIEPGARASDAIRAAATDLGLTPERGVRVRLTGSVALNDDELASVKDGAALSTGLSVVLVILFLFFALKSFRLVGVVLLTLAIGFACTAGFAAIAVGTLNVISVAFVVMFLGIAVDFAIQFTVRYRAERYRTGEQIKGLQTATRRIAMPLSLAAATTALGFLSFVPTDYRGVSELGLIAAAGMGIALVLSFTLLPALLTIVRPSPEPGPVGFHRAAPVDAFMMRHRRAVLAIGGIAALAALASLPWVEFDFNPLHLKDPKSESMATLLDLAGDPATTPFSANILTASADAAAVVAAKLEALPQIGRVMTLDSFVPDDQDQKLPILNDLNFFLGPSLSPPSTQPPPTSADLLESAKSLLEGLRNLERSAGQDGGRGDLDQALTALIARAPADETIWAKLHQSIVAGFLDQLSQLRDALSAGEVSRASLPEEIKRAWIAPDGEARVQAVMRGSVLDNDALAAFRTAVQRVAPEATGPAITIVDSADTITHALLMAGIGAAVAITIILFVALRRVSEVLYVLMPLILAALLTLATGVATSLPLNFANVIALPLLLGIGVAFDIYFVVRWREGMTDFLQSPTARAVLFSALTTIGAFGTLMLSRHRGTADMGALLVIALGYALVTTLFFLPALLGSANGNHSHRSGGHSAPQAGKIAETSPQGTKF
jgi:uncharacterized protein